MKTLLMHRDRDFEPGQAMPWNESALTQDLELNTLVSAMANGDEFVFQVGRQALLSAMGNDRDTILYRQAVLRDCLANPGVVRKMYDLAVDAMEHQRRSWLGIFSRYPSGILYDAVKLMQMFLDMLRKLRGIADAHASRFESEGFRAFFAAIQRELGDEYLASVQDHLTELKFRRGVLLSAELGEGNEGTNYVLRRARMERPNWLRRILGQRPPAYTFRLHPRDEAGSRILSDMRNVGLDLAANALAQSADHVKNFFKTLRTELAFYVGCLNLHARLAAQREPACFARPLPAGERVLHFQGLYDPCLSLQMARRVVGNTANADGRSLVIITGANQGGKSVFLRSIGLAQIMMQSGMFVAAESFEAERCAGLFTHYKREEDATMKSGKLDEELARMSEIVDHLVPNSVLLCNESFAATNQREGSEIARQIVLALLAKRIKVCFVTHLYEFARQMFHGRKEDALFLRAERLADGTRTFKLVEGEPLETSYGQDVYREVFGWGTLDPGEAETPRGLSMKGRMSDAPE